MTFSPMDVNDLQANIMRFIDDWARTEKVPIPLRVIIKNMKDEGVKDFTTINAIRTLLRKGYIRRAVGTSNKTSFVQLRRI